MTTNAVAFDNQADLRSLAQQARWQVIKTVMSSKAGHIGGPLSMIDLLVCLYFGELHIRPEDPDWVDRDRFILSKVTPRSACTRYWLCAGSCRLRSSLPSTRVILACRATRTLLVCLGSTRPPARSVRACPSGSAWRLVHNSAATAFTPG